METIATVRLLSQSYCMVIIECNNSYCYTRIKFSSQIHNLHVFYFRSEVSVKVLKKRTCGTINACHIISKKVTIVVTTVKAKTDFCVRLLHYICSSQRA